ncbi:hypothetical protein LPC08_15045 [Roseomonas sp. OT10]|uniref:hypothetical protein n=1 Tax=Roseomonas cutis TaxID=2897332 RepID=UPI001E577307|nr:hypothetical protein [Roseomonas sp. OT10]UFN47335.1 hypothetical protein LPC08_15045 [Roseomonas sp. OT10]
MPPAPALAPPPPPRPTPVATRPPAAVAEPRGGLMIGWLASLLLLGCAAVVAVIYRGAIMEAWPPAQRLYQALGLS